MTGLIGTNEAFTDHDILKEVEDAERKAKRINRRTKYSRAEVDKIVAEVLGKSADNKTLKS